MDRRNTQTSRTSSSVLPALAVLSVGAIALGAGFVFLGGDTSDMTTAGENLQANSLAKNKPGVSREASFSERVDRVQAALDTKRMTIAMIEAQNLLRDFPKEKQAYELLGDIYVMMNAGGKLEMLSQKIMSTFPGDSLGMLMNVRSMILNEQFTPAMEVLNSYDINSDTIRPEFFWYKALLQALQNNHTGTKETLTSLLSQPNVTPNIIMDAERVLSLYDDFDMMSDGKDPHLFALLAKALSESEEYPLSREMADIAIKEKFDYIDAWIFRGYANMMMGQTENAVLDLKQAYKFDSVRPETQYFLALALMEADQEEEAILYFEKSLSNGLGFEEAIRWKLVQLHTKYKNYDRSFELYTELLNEESNPRKFAPALQIALEQLNRPESALEMTRSMLLNNPSDTYTLNLHAWALIANGELKEAQETLESALRVDLNNPQTYLNLGLLAEQNGNANEAKEMYQKSYKLGSSIPNMVGVTNLAADRYNKLIEEVQ